MQIVPYSPERFPDLVNAVQKMKRGRTLAVPEIVNHYYLDNPWCKLYLAIGKDDHSILGIIGSESIPFLIDHEPTSIGFGSNFHTIEEGCGGLLFMKWVRGHPHSMAYNCSEDAFRLTTAQRWNRLEGVQTLSYNAPAYRAPGQSSFTHALKAVGKRLLNRPPLLKTLNKHDFLPEVDVSVREEKQFHVEMLTFNSAFDFRIAPDPAYLRWRFSTDWQPFHYRIFSIKRGEEYRGFVVLHDAPNQVSIVHADGCDPVELAKSEVLALAQISGKRPSYLCSSVSEITNQLSKIGFRINPTKPYVQFSPSLPITKINLPLINFGLGDNDLRMEFMYPPKITQPFNKTS